MKTNHTIDLHSHDSMWDHNRWFVKKSEPAKITRISPQVGDTWYCKLEGDHTLTTAVVKEITAHTVLLALPHGPESRYETISVYFVEKVY